LPHLSVGACWGLMCVCFVGWDTPCALCAAYGMGPTFGPTYAWGCCRVLATYPLRMSIAHTAWNCLLRVCAALPVQTVVFDKKKGAVNQTIQTLINRVRAGEVADMYVVLRVRVLVSWGAAVCACAELA
jgi:hypothetical protein